LMNTEQNFLKFMREKWCDCNNNALEKWSDWALHAQVL
jgi:hypothetical protein